MYFQSRKGLLLISLIEISISVHSYKIFEFYVAVWFKIEIKIVSF